MVQLSQLFVSDLAAETPPSSTSAHAMRHGSYAPPNKRVKRSMNAEFNKMHVSSLGLQAGLITGRLVGHDGWRDATPSPPKDRSGRVISVQAS